LAIYRWQSDRHCGGVLLLRWTPRRNRKIGAAALLISFSISNLVHPKVPSVAWAGVSAMASPVC